MDVEKFLSDNISSENVIYNGQQSKLFASNSLPYKVIVTNVTDFFEEAHVTENATICPNWTVFSDYSPRLLCFGAVSFITLSVLGVLGNFVSILALSCCKKLRNGTTAFIVNLCIADLLFCSVSMPLSAITFVEKDWSYGEVLCKFFALVRYSNGAVSLFSVIAITINRYILIVHPNMYDKIYRLRNLVIMIILIWLVSISLLLLPLLKVWGTLGYDREVGTCTILKLNEKSPKMFLYITAFILPSVIFIACYTRIFLVVRRSSRKSLRRDEIKSTFQIRFTMIKGLRQKSYRHSEMPEQYMCQRKRTDLRVLKVMLVVFIVFIVCYFPVSFVKIFNKEYDLPTLNVFGYLGVYFSNVINPVIYIVMSKEYRQAYRELFCRHKYKRKTMI